MFMLVSRSLKGDSYRLKDRDLGPRPIIDQPTPS
jgi:hypothetical protein